MNITKPKFHDIDVRFASVPRWRWSWKTTTTQKHFAIKEREVGYRFYPHFHPYVGAFAQRLIGKSVRSRGDRTLNTNATPIARLSRCRTVSALMADGSGDASG